MTPVLYINTTIPSNNMIWMKCLLFNNTSDEMKKIESSAIVYCMHFYELNYLTPKDVCMALIDINWNKRKDFDILLNCVLINVWSYITHCFYWWQSKLCPLDIVVSCVSKRAVSVKNYFIPAKVPFSASDR